MEVITREKDKCEKVIIDWFKEIFNVEDEEITNVIIYTNYGKIYEVSFEDHRPGIVDAGI